MSDSDLIDWEQLEMIFGEENEPLDDDMVELFQEFIEDGRERFSLIKGASFETDKERIAKESHKLKGSASNFGFIKVSSLLAGIENNIATIAYGDYERDLGAASRFFDDSLQEVVAKFPALSQS